MTATITTSKGTFMFVGVPEGAHEYEFLFSINAPIASIVVANTRTITEDQAREVVSAGLKNETAIDAVKRLMRVNGINTDEFPDGIILKVK